MSGTEGHSLPSVTTSQEQGGTFEASLADAEKVLKKGLCELIKHHTTGKLRNFFVLRETEFAS